GPGARHRPGPDGGRAGPRRVLPQGGGGLSRARERVGRGETRQALRPRGGPQGGGGTAGRADDGGGRAVPGRRAGTGAGQRVPHRGQPAGPGGRGLRRGERTSRGGTSWRRMTGRRTSATTSWSSRPGRKGGGGSASSPAGAVTCAPSSP